MTPPGNSNGYQNKELAGKAIRKNMKTKGEEKWLGRGPSVFHERNAVGVWRTRRKAESRRGKLRGQLGKALVRTSRSKIAGGGTRGQLVGGAVSVQVAENFGSADNFRGSRHETGAVARRKGGIESLEGQFDFFAWRQGAQMAFVLEVSSKPGPLQIKGPAPGILRN